MSWRLRSEYKTNIHPNSIKALKESTAGFKKGHTPHNKGKRLYDIDEMIRLYEEGLNCKQVSEKMGCSHGTVLRNLKAEGIKIRGPQFGTTRSKETNEKIVATFKKNYKKENHPKYVGDALVTKCVICNKEFRAKQFRLDGTLQATCGNKDCLRNYKSGTNAPNWRGGISKEDYGVNWNTLVKDKIRERDNYTCQLCNKHERNNGRKL